MLLDEINKVSEKIEKLADSENLDFKFSSGQFPIACVFTKKEDNQVSMIDTKNLMFGELAFIFDEQLQVSITDDFRISDERFNALKNNCKKLHYIYLQIYFMNSIDKERNNG